jgi:hypothetical protein
VRVGAGGDGVLLTPDGGAVQGPRPLGRGSRGRAGGGGGRSRHEKEDEGDERERREDDEQGSAVAVEAVGERAVVLAAVGQRGVARAHLCVGGEEDEVRGGGRAVANAAEERGSGRRLDRLLLLREIQGFRASVEGRRARWRRGNEAHGVGEKQRWWRVGRWRRSEMGGGTRWEAGRDEERPEG